MSLFKRIWALEPAILMWVLNGGLAALLAFVFHFGHTQEAAVTTIATAVVALLTAALAHPPAVPVLVGALATIAVAVGAFGLRLSPQVIAEGVTVLSAVLGLLLRSSLTPRAALREARAG